MCKISHYSSHYHCCFKAYKYIEKTFVELLKNNKSLRYMFFMAVYYEFRNRAYKLDITRNKLDKL